MTWGANDPEFPSGAPMTCGAKDPEVPSGAPITWGANDPLVGAAAAAICTLGASPPAGSRDG